ncbi:MAG: C-terminal binding protein [Planctomycetia bacterium]|nr:C-terminal binding protein [Planctomycetia bacterium]
MFHATRLNAVTYPLEPVEREELARAGAELTAIEGQKPEEIVEAARGCDALLVVSSRVPAEVIEKLARCRVISRLGAGTDRIDVESATRRGIVVANVPDFCENEQAEHTLALLLAFARRLPYMGQAMRQGDWTARRHPEVHRIAGRTLGLVGFGASAQAVARRASAFGLRLVAWARSPDKYQAMAAALGVELVDLDRLLAESDFVSIHLPLTPETRHLIDARKLARMKPSAVLVNTSRGAVIDEAALVVALQKRQIGGAALDVFEGIDVFALPGAPPEHPLLDLDNVLLTPHCAGTSVESSLESKLRGARHAADVLLGFWPPHVVNPAVQPRFPLRKRGE